MMHSQERPGPQTRDPVAAIVEAKNENIKCGLAQCIGAMVGARLCNEKEGQPASVIRGAVTSGSLWRFLQLNSGMVTLDQQEYHIRQVNKVLGILTTLATGSP